MKKESKRLLNHHLLVTALVLTTYIVYILSNKDAGTDLLERRPIYIFFEFIIGLALMNLMPFLNNVYFKFRYKRLSLEKMSSSIRIVFDTFIVVLLLDIIYNIAFAMLSRLEQDLTLGQMIISQVLLFLILTIYSSIYHGVFYTRLYIQRNIKLEQIAKEKLAYEIQYLRSNFNPGLIYKTLEYIEKLQYEDKNAALNVLDDFSKLLRYKIYEINSKTIPLEAELEYIDLYTNLLNAIEGFEIESDFTANSNDYQIKPLLLQTVLDLLLANKKKEGKIKIWSEIEDHQYTIIMNCDSTIPDVKQKLHQDIEIIKKSIKFKSILLEHAEKENSLEIKCILIS